jgi:hypothetical protein
VTFVEYIRQRNAANPIELWFFDPAWGKFGGRADGNSGARFSARPCPGIGGRRKGYTRPPAELAGLRLRQFSSGRRDRSGVNRLKLAWKILRLRQVSLSDERVPENFRTFSAGRLVGYP